MPAVDVRHVEPAEHDYVAFYATGQRIVGEFRCNACGYGIVCRNALPVCPMCHGSGWEESPWRPFTRRARQ